MTIECIKLKFSNSSKNTKLNYIVSICNVIVKNLIFILFDFSKKITMMMVGSKKLDMTTYRRAAIHVRS